MNIRKIKERERQTNRLLTIKGRWLPERRWVGGTGEIGERDQEYIYLDEHCVVYTIVESLYCNLKLIEHYFNYTGIKIKKKKKTKDMQD